jgi:hypothetical protein
MRNALTVAVLLSTAAIAQAAPNSVSLDFNGAGATVAATGFDGAYGFNATGAALGGGKLSLQTLPGDTFGNYGGPTDPGGVDPDGVQNFFYSAINPLAVTTVNSKVTVSGLNSNFHGGGIWMGVDTDHYIRLGVVNNSFAGGVVVEALRENQDLWGNNEQNGAAHGPGNDITGHNSAAIGVSPQVGSLDVYLRLVRTGHSAQAFYSLDNTTFTLVDGFTFDAISTDSTNLGVAGPSSVEDGIFKVGAYALGGGTTNATLAFDYLNAVSTPEPATLGSLALGGLLLRRRR